MLVRVRLQVSMLIEKPDTSVSTISYTTSSTNIVVHETRHPDTVITDTSTVVSPFTSSLLVTFDLAARLPTNNAGAGPTPTESELSDVSTVVYAQTVYAPRTLAEGSTKLIILTAHPLRTSSSTELRKSFLSLPSLTQMGSLHVSQLLPFFPPPSPLLQAQFFSQGSIRTQRRILVVQARLLPAYTNSSPSRLLMSPEPLRRQPRHPFLVSNSLQVAFSQKPNSARSKEKPLPLRPQPALPAATMSPNMTMVMSTLSSSIS